MYKAQERATQRESMYIKNKALSMPKINTTIFQSLITIYFLDT